MKENSKNPKKIGANVVTYLELLKKWDKPLHYKLSKENVFNESLSKPDRYEIVETSEGEYGYVIYTYSPKSIDEEDYFEVINSWKPDSYRTIQATNPNGNLSYITIFPKNIKKEIITNLFRDCMEFSLSLEQIILPEQKNKVTFDFITEIPKDKKKLEYLNKVVCGIIEMFIKASELAINWASTQYDMFDEKQSKSPFLYAFPDNYLHALGRRSVNAERWKKKINALENGNKPQAKKKPAGKKHGKKK